MNKPVKVVLHCTPIVVLLLFAILESEQRTNWNGALNYVGDKYMEDNGVGLFPLIWLIVVAPSFAIASGLCWFMARPHRRYWVATLGSFLLLSLVGLYLDVRAWHQICTQCVYMVPGL